MVCFFEDYNKKVLIKHGWDAQLTCSRCKYRGKPEIKSSIRNKIAKHKNNPQIHTILYCTKCGKDLKEEAECEIVKLFSEEKIPDTTKKMIAWSKIYSIILSLILLIYIYFLFFEDFRIVYMLPVFFIISTVFVVINKYFKHKFYLIHSTCDCGAPNYIFMGTVGKSCCFRCKSCRRLLRTRN